MQPGESNIPVFHHFMSVVSLKSNLGGVDSTRASRVFTTKNLQVQSSMFKVDTATLNPEL
jgi:hypothetical protein